MGLHLRLQSLGQEVDRINVFVDEHKMNQVIRNLLSNAMKFTPKGGEVTIELNWYETEENSEKVSLYQATTAADMSTKRSTISSSSSGEAEKSRDVKLSDLEAQKKHTCKCLPSFHQFMPKTRSGMPSHRLLHESVVGAKPHGILLISIIDSGPGVSKDDQKKLFHEYVQIRPGALQKGQGTGLGLSISKSIVALHGGHIGMFSDGHGHGSTFFIELPAYRGGSGNSHLQRESSSVSAVSKLSAPHFIPSSLSRAGTRRVLPISRTNSAVMAPQADEGLLASRSRSKYSKSNRNILKQSSIKSNISNSLQLSDADDNEVIMVDRADSLTLVPQDIHETSTMTVGQETDDEINGFIARSPHQQESLSHAQSVYPAPSSSHSDAIFPYVMSTRGSILFAPKSYHILVVDDSYPNRKMLSRLLQREGHIITEADDGTTAIRLIEQMIDDDMNSMREALSQQINSSSPFSFSSKHQIPPSNDGDNSPKPPLHSFDFILLDFHMTHMNGPETAMRLRTLGYSGPIIGVTGVMDEESNDFINHGADIVLTKPIKVQMIWKALNSLLFL